MHRMTDAGWDVDHADGRQEMHIFLAEDDEPRPKFHDAARRGRDQPTLAEMGDPTSGRDPDDLDGNGEPAVYLDARSLRLRGRDTNGKQFEARVYGPGATRPGWAPAERDNTPVEPPPIAMTGNRDHVHTRDLARMQAFLNGFYAKR